jgi:protein-disulfide isomerase
MTKWTMLMGGLLLGLPSVAQQSTPTAGAVQQPAAALQIHGLDPSARIDPFPATDPKNFTATSPTTATVDQFLTALWGYDTNRLWRVFSIQSTAAPGVSRVTVLVTEKTANAKVQPTAFFVTPDGKHAIAGDGVVEFGAKPFAEAREKLQARADGPARGSASKALELVEFADMQCPHCKDAQASMDRLLQDFPNARLIYQHFPIPSIHPFAMEAAEFGVCVAKAKPEAFWTYLQAVYDTQGGLTAGDGNATLKAAVTKAGRDPAAVATCAATPAAKAQVEESIRLGTDVGVDQTPILAINGHMIPVSPASIPYETLKQIVQFQAQQDGVR